MKKLLLVMAVAMFSTTCGDDGLDTHSLPPDNQDSCARGNYKCQGDIIYYCSGADWNFHERCDYGCFNSSTCYKCQTGQKRCVEDNVYECNRSDNTWQLDQRCSAGCNNGRCVGGGECTPGQTREQPCGNCGTRSRTCNQNGTWGDYGTCQDEGCHPGDTISAGCHGRQYKVCQEDCQWGPCEEESSGQVGDPCESNDDCLNNGLCAYNMPGGYCFIYGCESDTCPLGSTCYNIGEGGDRACLDKCPAPGTRSDCRQEYLCWFDNIGDGYCFPQCTNDTDCAGGYQCTEDGFCEEEGAGVCTSGQTRSCGNCGTETCVNNQWGGSCVNQGVCARGQTTTSGCSNGAHKTCNDSCQWGSCQNGGVCQDDRFEDNDTINNATRVNEGVYNSLQICSGDDDYYAVGLNVGNTLTVILSLNHSNGDIDMKLLLADGELLETSQSTSNEERIDFTAAIAHTYIIKVYGYEGAENSYSMTIEISGGGGVCTSGQTRSCGNCGTESCVNNQWSGSCAGQGVCSPGQTITSGCSNGAYKTCNDSCQWGSCHDGGVCTSGQTRSCGNCGTESCVNNQWSGSCVGQGCAPGTTSTSGCSSGARKTCNGSCQWGPCENGCEDDCVSGNRRCSGNQENVWICGNFDSDPCTEWGGMTECPPGLVCLDGRCVTSCVCDPNEEQCANNISYTCTDDCRTLVVRDCRNVNNGQSVCQTGNCALTCCRRCSDETEPYNDLDNAYNIGSLQVGDQYNQRRLSLTMPNEYDNDAIQFTARDEVYDYFMIRTTLTNIPIGHNYALSVWRRDGSSWTQVAESLNSGNADEEAVYCGRAFRNDGGTYVVRVSWQSNPTNYICQEVTLTIDPPCPTTNIRRCLAEGC